MSSHSSRPLRALLASPIVLAALLIAAAIAPGTAQAQSNPCSAPVTNPVACENTQPGNPPSEWQVFGSGDDSIQGFATQMSVNKGETIGFKVKSTTSNYRINIYRLGYYNGDGARLVAGNLAPTGTSTQPACMTDSSSGLIDCGNWATSRTWTVPSTAVSGVYIANLDRVDGNGSSQIIFVVRDDSRTSDVTVQTSDTTWQAYNKYGGNSLYACTVACPAGNPLTYKAAYKVSYNRPLDTERESALFTGAEYSMIRFLERNGYNAEYISGVDAHARPSSVLTTKLFLSSGHDEYWSANQRANVEAARNAGVNLGFFSGNEMFWKTRFESSMGSSPVANRTLVSYKDTHFTERQDPVSWTGTWHDPRYTSASENVTPPNALVGQNFVVNSGTSRITVPGAYRNFRLWRNTSVASLTPTGSLQLAPDTLGYEWDADVDNGFRPAGTFRLSSTTVSGVEAFTDYGSTTQFNSTVTHNLTMYRHSSGARVFGAGTVQWAWGLDDWNESGAPADRNMQQATVNLFGDMGVQPRTRQSNLVAASASGDGQAPTVSINSLPSTIADGTRVTISGTATDVGGGQVGGVEVSTDGGNTWRMANGTTSWSYSWLVHGHPTANVRVRAVDDSGNLGSGGSGVNVNVTCPCSIWGSGMQVPAADQDLGDPTPIEVGVKFRSDRFGTISGIRFYKGSGNTGTHIGNLWSSDGQRLATATFTGESASGWQSVTFPNPVEVQPNTTYIASYYAPNGHYAGTPFYFYRGPAPTPAGGAIVDSVPLHAVNNTGTQTNGVYSYGSGSAFPTSTYQAANYWVDVTFNSMPAPGTVTNVQAAAGGATKANLTWNAPTSGGTVTEYRITPYVGSTPRPVITVPGTQTSKSVTGLTTGTTYTFSVRAVNPNGQGPESARSNAVTPLGPVVPSAPTNVAAEAASNEARVTWTAPANDGDSAITHQTVTPYVDGVAQDSTQVGASATSATIGDLANGTTYTFKVTATNAVGTSSASPASNAVTPQATIFDLAVPQTVDSDDGSAVELGVRFRSDSAGMIAGIRFYKAAGNTGTHTGSLWSADGTRLAQVTFTNESASGWQTATFANPVSISANTTYVASYFAPNGHYSATNNGLASPVDNPPLHALANGSGGGNGVYQYGATSSFPDKTWNATNYFVDVMFAVPPPGQVTNVSATESGSTSARVSWTPPSSGGAPTSYRITPYVGSTARPSTTVAAPATSKIVGGLTSGTAYTFRVTAVNANGSGPASSPSNSVTPSAPVVPNAPTNVKAAPATRSARVTWDPAPDGDHPVTGQTVTPYVNGQAQSPTQVGAAASSVTLNGLNNGTKYTFRVSATNSVGTSQQSATSNEVIPRSTILDFNAPGTADTDTVPIELGVKFQSDSAGVVTGVRFHKGTSNTGTHIGSLWTSGGQRLAQATFTNETASGWQHVLFATPVEIQANTTYIASYFAPNGGYSATGNAFATGVDNPPLHAMSNAVTPNGVYAYSPSSTFPGNSFNATNYGVDVMFAPPPEPGEVTGVTATAAPGAANVSWTAPSEGGAVTSYKITPYIGSNAQTPETITGTPPATSTTIGGLSASSSYTFRVQAINSAGAGPVSAPSNAVTPQGAQVPAAPTNVTAQADSKSATVDWTAPAGGDSPVTGYTVTPFAGSAAGTPVEVGASTTRVKVTGLDNGTAYTFRVKARNGAGTGPDSSPSSAVTPRASIFELATPATVDGDDSGSVNLGVKLKSDVPGRVTGIRFYKAPANTGTHVGSLWTEGGSQLGSAAFTNETASGWQSVTFDNPVDINADQTYIASYLAPNGHYSVTGAAFATNPVDNPPLHALASPLSSNGVYVYGGSTQFPTNTFNAANYWVDVLFTPAGS